MSKMKTLVAACILFVSSLGLLSGNAFADAECDIPCYHSTDCKNDETEASFEDFTPSVVHNGKVCHPSTSFEFFVTDSSYGTDSSYILLDNFLPYTETFVSGHPYYKIIFQNKLDDNNFIAAFTAISLVFINNDRPMTPQIYIEAFDQNANLIYSDTLTSLISVPLGSPFVVQANVNTMTSNVSYLHINTFDKHGLSGIKVEGLQ